MTSSGGGAGNDAFAFETAAGRDVIQDFDLGDADQNGFTNDRLDVTDLTDPLGQPVKTFDVAILDDGQGNAVLTFPGGEQITIIGLSPAAAAAPGMLYSMGIPCFAAGTRILTPEGERPVEQIRAGDRVVTADGSCQPVLWQANRRLDAQALQDQPNLRPIRLRAGRFGNRRDLTLSPQHAVLVGGRLIRARHLAQWAEGARVARGMTRVSYHHLLLPRHALIRAEGSLAESFYPGPVALAALTLPDRLSLAAVILRRPGTATSCTLSQAYGPPCQPVLTGAAARAWLRRDLVAPGPERRTVRA